MAAKPIFMLTSYHPKDDEFPLALGAFVALVDAMEAAAEMAPQVGPLNWVIHNNRETGVQMHSIDDADTRYTIREVAVTNWVN